MVAGTTLVLKDDFISPFTSIQAILNYVDFPENYEITLTKYSSSCANGYL